MNSMKGLVLYKSTYGSTEQYARWISEETGFDCLPLGKQSRKQLAESDVIIAGAPIWAGHSSAGKWISKNWSVLKDKKVVYFTTSGAPPTDPEVMSNYESRMDQEVRRTLKYFPLGGRIDLAKLKPLHRFMVKLGAKMEEDEAVRERMGKGSDYVERSSIGPLIEYVK